jgi:hypothetical protein
MAGGTSSPKISIESKNFRCSEEFDLLSKLRHGYMVTDIEKETLLALAAGLEDEAKAVDAEIARLVDSRDKLRRAAEQATSLVAPIRRLPPEILTKIFSFTYSTINCRYSERATANCGFPMIRAGKICSSWRQLVLTTPSLWTHITITMYYPSSVQGLEQLLAMSGNMPLYLTVLLCSLDYGISSDLSSLIRQHFHRLKHITLQGRNTCLVEVFNPPSLSALSLPELSSLQLTWFLVDGGPYSTMTQIPPAPNLRTLFLENACDDGQRLSIDLPWEQLEELTIRAGHFSEAFFALSKCTSIQKATLISVGWFPSSDISQTIGQNPSPDVPPSTTLTKFEFVLERHAEYAAMGECFNKLTLSALKELDIGACWDGMDHVRWDSQWPADSFKAFTERSGFALTTLRILQFPIEDISIISILECLPQLEELVLKDKEGGIYLALYVRSEAALNGEHGPFFCTSCLTNRLMDRLRVGPPVSKVSQSNPSGAQPESSSVALTTTTLVPYLKRLELEGEGASETFSFERFLDMVKSRRRAPDGSILNLKSVELRVSGQPVGEAIQEEIARLSSASDGFVLDVDGATISVWTDSESEYEMSD